MTTLNISEAIYWAGLLFEQNGEDGIEHVYNSGVFVIGSDGKYYEHKLFPVFPPYKQDCAKGLRDAIEALGSINLDLWNEIDEEDFDAVIYPYGKTPEEVNQSNLDFEAEQRFNETGERF